MTEFKRDTAFLSGRFKSIGYAVRGARKLVMSEHSIMAQFFIAILLIGAGFYFGISATEWMLQIFATGLVLAAEGCNTAIEKICDFIQPKFDERIGFIKDIAAGAVLFAALAALAIGSIIYLPKIF